MSDVKYPEITVQLVGQDGNAFNLLGLCLRAMRRANLSGHNGRFWKRCCLNQSLSQRKHLVRCRF